MQAGMAHGTPVPAELEELVRPHIDSFDYFLTEGLDRVVERLQPVETALQIEHPITKQTHRVWFENPQIGRPLKEDAAAGADRRLFPRDCREGGATYRAAFHMDLCYQVEGQPAQRLNKRLGYLPIMVKSRQCYLRHLNRRQLVAHKEESTEMGGYFICNGIERIIRMLIVQRRHYIMGLKRSAYKKRGNNYTETATLLRCVAPDESSHTVRCHYLQDGNVNFAFTIRRAEYFVPIGILLKCFLEVTDRELYEKLMAGAIVTRGGGNTSFVAERAEMVIQTPQKYGLYTRAQAIEYLGNFFRGALEVPARKSDYQAGMQLLREHVFIHLEHPADRLNLLLAMLNKLFALASGECCEDNPDALTHHEILMPGHLMCKFMKERLEESQNTFRDMVRRDLDKAPEGVNLQSEAYVKKVAEKLPDLGQRFIYMINTGNVISRGGLDLSQSTGFTVVAEKLNFHRYLSHFRSVHRGAYFAELRTTTVRKLLPESWGFLCPVHTPDGSPCGLLTHFTAACQIITHRPDNPEAVETALLKVLHGVGMVGAVPTMLPPATPAYTSIQLDGKVAGYIPADRAGAVVARLRDLKAAALALHEPLPQGASVVPTNGEEQLMPSHTEVIHLPYEHAGPFGGIFIFTQGARMMRPVQQVGSKARELVGTLEQSNMSISVPDGGTGGSEGLKFSHCEFHANAMLSVIASLTPYSDYNQSPRNMYQCQMAKQTMGTPVQALPHRTDGKLYKLQTPQTPLARTARYDQYCMDEFPNGTNMVVAVLAYTGYDMEDAMILNKSAVERGLAHATLYKTETLDLHEERGKDIQLATELPGPRDTGDSFVPIGAFGQRYPQNVHTPADSPAVKPAKLKPKGLHKDADRVDSDGLPHVGAVVWPGQSYYSTKDVSDGVNGRCKPHNLKGEEVGIIDQVAIVGTGKDRTIQKANIKMRINRNPVIGDKFASRHGQKGVLSVQWRDSDMPFCEATGIRPDLIINPHAFPSRMTIGMLVESLTSKTGALSGQFPDASPFQKCDNADFESPLEQYGTQLEAAGFAKHGGETMISGVTGEEFKADIFIGLVYYQRLRHMVSDKFQVRSTGPVNPLTRQPIKGRKFGGGIRFGEMERDSLLAHGAAYLLHDRLHTCSDYTVMEACAQCGSLLSPQTELPTVAEGLSGQRMLAHMTSKQGGTRVVCRFCESSNNVEKVALPYVFKYLIAELAAMNIKCSLTLKS